MPLVGTDLMIDALHEAATDAGSRAYVVRSFSAGKDGEVETFHRPHPAKEAKRYQVRAARAFLERIGVTP